VSTTALVLALAAACLHAFWNLLIARARDPEAATAVALCIGVVAFAPFAVATLGVGRDAIPYIAASSALELVYIVLLAAAYRRANLSLVYPIARGLAPVFVLLVAALALGAATNPAEVLGVVVVVLGVLAVRGVRDDADRRRRGLVFAVVIAATIASYTLIDNSGIERAQALSYFEVTLIGPAIVYLVAIVALRGRSAVGAELSRATAFAGVAMFGAYLLALIALEHAPAAPVAAIRETSVVIATALAVPVLRERVTPLRFAGAVLVVTGVALLAL
jgi:drug/metabolite transporter (DMT)-like permease